MESYEVGHKWVLSIWDCRKCVRHEEVIWCHKPSKSDFKRELCRFLAQRKIASWFSLDGTIKDDYIDKYVGNMYEQICANWNNWKNGNCAIYDYCVGINEYVDGKRVSF